MSLASALIGALGAVREAAALPPAEAMRPPAPPMFRRTALSRLGFIQRLDQPTRILLRQIARWPGRSFITAAGIAMSVAVLVTSMQWLDAINRMVDVYFLDAQAQDISVGFGEPRSSEVERDLARLPGVLTTEPMRAVAAKMRAGSSARSARRVQGLPANQELYRVYDAQGREVRLPPEGLVISTMLAKLLDVGIGDRITVEVLEGRRPVFEVPVVDTFETYIGSPAYMDIRALDRLMRERPSVTAVHLRVDDARRAQLFRELKNLPRVSSVTVKDAAVQTFHETMAKTITIFISFFIVFSCALAFGVTYNAARISLSERGRELATLRVLGFTRAEISYILLGEVALLTFVALPLGCAFRLPAREPDRARVRDRALSRADGDPRLDLRLGNRDRRGGHRRLRPPRPAPRRPPRPDRRAQDPGVKQCLLLQSDCCSGSPWRSRSRWRSPGCSGPRQCPSTSSRSSAVR